MFKFKTLEEDLSLINASQKLNFKFQATVNPIEQAGCLFFSKNTEADKRVSATVGLLLLKSQTIFQSQIAYFGQCISTKDGPFV